MSGTSGIIQNGRGQQHHRTVTNTLKNFDEYQLENSSPPLESMDHAYLSSEFPGDLISYFEHLIDTNTDAACSGIEAKIKTTLQAIGEKFATNVLDTALKDYSNKTYVEFQKMILERVTRALSLERDQGIRASDVANCKTLPIVARFDECDHRYAINLPIVCINLFCLSLF
jgi:hypothetical protein